MAAEGDLQKEDIAKDGGDMVSRTSATRGQTKSGVIKLIVSRGSRFDASRCQGNTRQVSDKWKQTRLSHSALALRAARLQA